MTLAQQIDELPDGNTRVATLHDLDGFPDTELGTTADLKRLVALLRRCEPVVRSMSNATGIVGDESHKLLGEIREVLGNGNS